jgi:hypothetical protein
VLVASLLDRQRVFSNVDLRKRSSGPETKARAEKLRFKSASLDCRITLNYAIMRNQTMKVQLLGLFASGLLCGCAANTPYSETVVDTNKRTQERGLPETEVYNRPIYTPGTGAADNLSGGHF